MPSGHQSREGMAGYNCRSSAHSNSKCLLHSGTSPWHGQVTKSRVMAQEEEEVTADGIAAKRLHTTSPGSLLGRRNTALESLKVPRRNRSPRKDTRQSSAGRLQFASANLGCLLLQRRLQLACLGKKEKRGKRSLCKAREVPFARSWEPSAPGGMQSRLWVPEHAAPPAKGARVGTPSRSSSGAGMDESESAGKEPPSRLLCSQRSLTDRNGALKNIIPNS